MKKNFLRVFLCLALLTTIAAATASSAAGQLVVQPGPFYRFRVSDWDGGYLLTAWYSEGEANGYTSNPMLNLGIYQPPPGGYVPSPGTGLVPLHRWLVIQNGWRTYFYYSTGYLDLTGTDYHYQGIAGYVYPPGTTHTPSGQPLNQLSVFYSQDLGYWYGFGGNPSNPNMEAPPSHSIYQSNYYFHGFACAMPFASISAFGSTEQSGPEADVVFTAPPPPPGGGGGGGTCTTPQGAAGACQHNGGWWDYESCTCEY